MGTTSAPETRAPSSTDPEHPPAVALRGAGLRLGGRMLWQDLDLDVAPGEFVAVLGHNGSGKTSLLRVLLGLVPLSVGTVLVNGVPPRRGSSRVGYIPQQKGFDADLGIRGRDLVALAADGHRFGLPWSARGTREQVVRTLAAVGATEFAERPVGLLSGGEQQRLRTAQALLSRPDVLLCDEPLLSLDLANQRAVVQLIDDYRRSNDTAVVFVTHEINPVLPVVDRIVYLVDGRWVAGRPDEVMTSECLSRLFGSPIEVLRTHGRIIVLGAPDQGADEHPHQH